MNAQVPDEKINVAAVYPEGLVAVYGAVDFEAQPSMRPLLYRRSFPCWGHAVEWADEYEVAQRREWLRRSR